MEAEGVMVEDPLPRAEKLPVAVGAPLSLRAGVAEALLLAPPAGEPLELAVGVGGAVGADVAVGAAPVAEGVPEGEGGAREDDGCPLGEAVPLVVPLSLPLRAPLPLSVDDGKGVALPVREGPLVSEGSSDAVGSGVAPPLRESEAAGEVEREGDGEGAPDAVGDGRREAAGEGDAEGGAVLVGVPRGEGEGVWRPLAEGVPPTEGEREAPPLPVGDSFGDAEGELSLLPVWAAEPDGSALGPPVLLTGALEVALARKALGVPLPPAAVGVGGAEGGDEDDAAPLAVPTPLLEALPPPSKEDDARAVALTPLTEAPGESVKSEVGVPLLQAEGVGESVPPAPRAVAEPRMGDPLALCDGCTVREVQREGTPDALPPPLAEALPEALTVALPPKEEGEGATGVAEGHREGTAEALPGP